MPGETTELERRQEPTAPLAAPLDPRKDPMLLGKVMAASGLFGDARNENVAIVKIIAGQALGVGELAAMTGIHIIEGKPVIGSNLMATLVRRHPRYEYRVTESTNQGCSIEFYERGGEGWQLAGVSRFTWDDAVKAEVAGKKNWKKHPKNMLFARAMSDGVKFYAPDVTAGAPVYTPEELDVEIDEETGEVAADIPPVSLPHSVAAEQGVQATASPVQSTEEWISPGQQRYLFKLADNAGIKGDERLMRALILWAGDVAHTDRIPKSRVNDVYDAFKDHEATVAVIRDKAQEGDELAQQIVQRFLGGAGDVANGDPGPEDGGPEADQQELG